MFVVPGIVAAEVRIGGPAGRDHHQAVVGLRAVSPGGYQARHLGGHPATTGHKAAP